MSPRLTQFTAVGLAAALLGASALQVQPLNSTRQHLDFTYTGDLATNSPPWMSYVLAIGGIGRSLAALILWQRANDMKQQGKHYEAFQLADLICKIQPRYPAVWRFHAWNMAFNISVQTHTAKDRWFWVSNAIRLLRDEGIRYNPRAVKLYQELAWTFYFKMGDMMDDLHLAYKKRWAREMHALLGAPPLNTTTEAAIAAIETIANSPPTLDALRSQRPQTAEAIDALYATGFKVDTELMDARLFLERLRYAESVGDPEVLKQFPVQEQILKLRAWEENPAFAEVRPIILNTIRQQILREHYKMDAQYMADVMRKFNVPFDWRQPHPHAVYWASMGLDLGRKLNANEEIDFLNSDRLNIFTMRYLLSRGRLVYQPLGDNPDADYYAELSDWRYAEAVNDAYRNFVKRWTDEDPDSYRSDSMRGAYANIVREIIEVLYRSGQVARAQELLDYLRTTHRNFDGTMNPEFAVTLDEFVLQSVIENAGSMKLVNRAIESALVNGFMELVAGNAAGSNYAFAEAKLIYDTYMREVDEVGDRRTLPRFEEMLADTAAAFILDPTGGPTGLVAKSRLWQALPVEVQRRIYDRISSTYANVLASDPRLAVFQVDRLFPEPAGMEQARREMLSRRGTASQTVGSN